MLWASPYVSTALYGVGEMWCWVVAQSSGVPPRRICRGGTEGRVSPAGRPQKVPRRGERSEGSRPVGESTGGGAGAGGVAWKFKPRGEDRRKPITL